MSPIQKRSFLVLNMTKFCSGEKDQEGKAPGKGQAQLRVGTVEEPERLSSGRLFTRWRRRIGAGAEPKHPAHTEKPWMQAAGRQSRSCLLSAG